MIGALSVAFTPSNFISASGQLDNAGSEEIVVGADGAPGEQVNTIRVFTAAGGLWKAESVDVGSYGVTSIAIGQVGLRPPAIYVGLRKSGGNGRVVELVKSSTGWQTTVVAESISESAYVTGIRATPSGSDLMITLFPRFGPDAALYRAAYEGGAWKVSLLNQDASHPGGAPPSSSASRGAGIVAKGATAGGTDRVMRLLVAGGIQIAGAKTYPSVDEFDDTTIAPLWTFNGTVTNAGSWTVTESGGLARIQTNWTSSSSTNAATAWLETSSLWAAGNNAVLISIPSIGHSTGGSSSSGSSSVQVGATTIYSVGPRQSASNVLFHLLRMGSFVYYRTKVDTAAWSNWGSCADSSTLRFQATGQRGSSTAGAGGANVHVDYVRFLSASQLVTSATATSDFSNSEAAFYATTGTWCFMTPSAQSWLGSQLHAFARGGNLVTIDSAGTNSWLQGKFTGDFWTGYHRDFSTSPWKWVNNSSTIFAPLPWAAGQPGGGSDQLFAFANNGSWASGTGNEAKPGVFEVKQPLVEVSTVVETEPTAAHRLQWAGQTLTTGRFNASVATQTSAIEAFVDDKDGSNTVTAGDEFVIAEYVIDSSPAVVRTLSRRTLPDGTLVGGYGFAAVRSRSGTGDFLVTGENDGQVFAWLPPAAGGTAGDIDPSKRAGRSGRLQSAPDADAAS